jgi:hypothetical protein
MGISQTFRPLLSMKLTGYKVLSEVRLLMES